MPPRIPPTTDNASPPANPGMEDGVDVPLVPGLAGPSPPEPVVDDSLVTDEMGLPVEGNVSPIASSLVPESQVPDDSERPGKVDPDDFKVLGLAHTETRLNVIRRAADYVISRALSETPAANRSPDRVVRVAAATYRLLDPRYRDPQFHRIRVGRIMPLVLARASYTEFTKKTQTIDAKTQASAGKQPRLFGAVMPLEKSAAKPDGKGKAVRRSKQARSRRRKRRRGSASGAEANEVLAELQSLGGKRRWVQVLQTPFGIAMVSVAAIFAMMVVSLSWPDSTESDERVVQQVSNLPATTERQPTDEETIRPDLTGSDSAAASTENTSSPVNRNALDLPPGSASVKPVEAVPSASGNKTIPGASMDDLLAELETHRVKPGNPNNEPKANARPATQPANATGSRMPNVANVEAGKANGDKSADQDAQAAERMSVKDDVQEAYSQDEMTEAIQELWEETETRYSQFTSTRVVELMDRWDLLGQVSGPGSLEYAAATHLNLQAAWLVSPLSSMLQLARQANDIRSGLANQSLDSPSTGSLSSRTGPKRALNEPELQLLVLSWRQCREKVSRSEDLNRMLLQGNGLLDHILVNDVISESIRQSLLSSLQVDLARLGRIVANEKFVQETNDLIEAVQTLPPPVDLNRLEASDKPSALLARVRCLKQRRWATHLAELTHATNPALASCAKAELEWLRKIQSDDAPDQVTIQQQYSELASRWTKIATRFTTVEAANIYLHAIDLLGDAQSDSQALANQRKEIAKNLPSYLTDLAN